jgi:hypothetical protein
MMAMEEEDEAPVVQCANPDCKIASGGRCVEGFPDGVGCPQFGKILVIEQTADAVPPKTTTPGLRLPHAEALSEKEAESALRQKPCNVITLVGPQDSGKTSLIAGVYDLLQQGPVGGYGFAGSSTMHAFERACHDSRRESQRDTPHQERTERGEVLFFHLDLVGSDCAGKRAALLGNRAGEEYMNAQNEPELVLGYSELKRSDTMTVLADGAKLLDAGERHQVRSLVRLTLRAFLEMGVTRPWQRLALVLTKLDAIHTDKDAASALRFFDAIVESVCTEFAAHFVDIQAFRVAASPKNGNADRGEGMVELLRYWMAESGRYTPAPSEPGLVRAERAFGRLSLDSRRSEA